MPRLTGRNVKIIRFPRRQNCIDALNMLSEQSGINMVASSDAAKTQVSMTLRNVSAKLAVETLCQIATTSGSRTTTAFCA